MFRQWQIWTLVGIGLALNESAVSGSGGRFADKLRQTVTAVAKSSVTISDLHCDAQVIAGFKSSSSSPSRLPASVDLESVSRASVSFRSKSDGRRKNLEAEFLNGAISQIKSLSSYGTVGREIVVEDRVWKSLAPRIGEFKVDAVGRDSHFELSRHIDQKALIERLGPLIESCCQNRDCRKSFSH